MRKEYDIDRKLSMFLLVLLPFILLAGFFFIEIVFRDPFGLDPHLHIQYLVSKPLSCKDGDCSVTVTMKNNNGKDFHLDWSGVDGPFDGGGEWMAFMIGKDGHRYKAWPDKDNSSFESWIKPGETRDVVMTCYQHFTSPDEVKSIELFDINTPISS